MGGRGGRGGGVGGVDVDEELFGVPVEEGGEVCLGLVVELRFRVEVDDQRKSRKERYRKERRDVPASRSNRICAYSSFLGE